MVSVQFLYMPVESLELGEEGALGEVAIHDPHGVVGVVGGEQVVTCLLDSLQVPGRYVSGGADESEIHFFRGMGCRVLGVWGVRFTRSGHIAGAARHIWRLDARFPRLKPWVYGYVKLFEPF